MLTVATWNLENFFRPGADAGPTFQEAYDDKLAHLKATIEAIAPDVLGVQEVGQPDALEDLRPGPRPGLARHRLPVPRWPRHPRRLPEPAPVR